MELETLDQVIDLSSKTAIVTGGAMGIGYGIAYRLAESHANVVIADINSEAAETAAATLREKGWEAKAVCGDVSQKKEVESLLQAAVEAYGSIDILVNNAGIYPNLPVLQMEEKDFEKIISVNLKSIFLTTQIIATQMIAQGKGGKIINITSIDAVHPSAVGLATYDASKHGVWGFTKNTALELAPHGISVNAIAPGAIATPGTGVGNGSKNTEEIMKNFLAKIPMRRIGEPDDIGKVALFLASNLSSYMTGSQIVVDGGVLLS